MFYMGENGYEPDQLYALENFFLVGVNVWFQEIAAGLSHPQ